MKFARSRVFLKKFSTLLLGILGCVATALAYSDEPGINFNIPSQPLDTALLVFSEQADIGILGISELLTQRTSPPILGKMSLTKALDLLLNNTGLSYKVTQNQSIAIVATAQPVAKTIANTARPVRELEEIIVTSTKRSTDLQNTPIAVTVISQTMLDRNQAKDIRDLTDIVPGLEMTNTGVQSALLVQLRGIGQTNITEIADGPVAIHIDGVYSPRAQGAATLLYDIERVEVLRGPQGTLFGRNATSGGINIQTQKPRLDSYSADGSLSFGNYNREAVKAAVNIPLTDNFAMRVAGALDKHDAYTDLITNYAGLGPQYPATVADLNDYQQVDDTGAAGPDTEDQLSLRISTLWQPTQHLAWSASLERYTDNGTSVTELDPTLVERGDRVTVSDTPAFIDLTHDVLRSRVDYTFSDDYTFSYILGAAQMKREQAFDVDKGRSGNYEQRRTVSSNFRFQSHELQLMNSDKAHFRWIVGAFYSQEKNDIVFTIDQADDDGNGDPTNTTSFISDDSGAAVAFFVQPDRRVVSKAVFAQGTHDITNASRFTAGIRFTKDTKSDHNGRSLNCSVTAVGPYLEPGSIGPGAPSDQQIYADAGAQAAINAGLPYDNGTNEGIGDEPCWVRQVNDYSATWRNTSGLLRYEYDLMDDVMMYVSAATGFKSGHIQDRGNEADPEEVINYELGLKSTLLDGKMRLNTALYFAEYTDLQFSDRDSFDTNDDGIADRVTSTIVRNAAEATVKGLELELNWAMSEVDYLQMAVAFMDAEFDDFQTPDTLFGNLFNDYAPGELAASQDIVDLSGNSPVRAPDWKLTLAYEHDFEFASGLLTSRIKATFSDEYFLDIYNRSELAAGVFDSAPNGAKNLAVQERYQTLDLSFRYVPDDGNWALEAYVNNATDENIKTSSGTFITPKGFDAIYLPPRTAGMTFSYHFE